MRQESGTEAQRLAYDTTSANPAGALPVLSTWEVTSGPGQGNKYTWGVSAWVQTRSGGAARVKQSNSLPPGTPHRREKIALDGTVVIFGFSATPIKAARISSTSDTAHTAEMRPGIAVAIDPPNAAIAAIDLTEGTSLTGDTNRDLLPVGSVEDYVFTDPDGNSVTVDYIAVKLDDGGGTARVVVMGIE